jgi:hypothetical protein
VSCRFVPRQWPLHCRVRPVRPAIAQKLFLPFRLLIQLYY